MKIGKLVTFSLIVLIIFSLIVLIFYLPKEKGTNYKYREVIENIEFLSNKVKPLDYLHQIKEKRHYFILTAEMEKENIEINPKMAQAITLYNAVLFANKRELITILKVFKDHNLQYCQTNLGDLRKNIEISVNECNKILTNLDSNFLIEIKKPQNYSYSKIIVEPPIITIIPKSPEKIQEVNYLLLKAIFPNTDNIIGAVNKNLEKLK